MPVLRDGSTTNDARLDRLVQFDERSKNFPIRAIVPKAPRGRGWSVKHWLDQRSEGACVSFAWHHEALALPKRALFASDSDAEDKARIRYHVMQTVDEWPGEAYEGTSVLAGAKVMQSLGYFEEYRWAFTLKDIILAIGYEGPVVMGTDWYEDMFEPDSKGYLHVSGGVAGGHGYLLSSVSVAMKRFTVWNSWGQDWGDLGRAYITFDDMERLLLSGGECCVPVGRKVV